MAKKGKSTLKDLNAFLKQKPNTLVDVDQVDTIEAPASQPELSESGIIEQIELLAQKNGDNFRNTLLNLIQSALDGQKESNASDIMLLNTVLYLQHTEKVSQNLENLAVEHA
ncbi:hypothetical protein QQ008_10300 [Fulvivirgaceae bacterium BMA10]|uniref:Uncharacterized protein n=1 Tax=Splendidivirga corallicola TaxID=3051826 RepID=A0ABT8KM04_9BACT|nr:hypothetical protein [Fulvivirgaceae bacterium BMA10]